MTCIYELLIEWREIAAVRAALERLAQAHPDETTAASGPGTDIPATSSAAGL